MGKKIRMLSDFIGVLHDKWLKERTKLLMLTRRAEGQKPCPALSFQNAEQSFFGAEIETLRIQGFVLTKSGTAM